MSDATMATRSLTDCNTMLLTLHSWAQAGWIRWLDVELANFLFQEAQSLRFEPSPLLLLGAALCSHQNGHGHLCLDLGHCLQNPDQSLLLPPEHALHTPDITPDTLLTRISLPAWIQAFTQSALCVQESPESEQHQESAGRSNAPLVLYTDQHSARLYLHRYWQYECKIKKTLWQTLKYTPLVDELVLRESLDRLFSDDSHSGPERLPNWQKIACALSVRSQFAIITGGPGTGKTTTVVKLLSVLQTLHRRTHHTTLLRIKLAAPTGKAAARLSASIAAQVTALADSTGIPREVSTLHRLLGPIRHSRFFKHNASNPLPADVVVVDEASMVDVELMAQLMDALPAHCRLILLGDKDQLASVEAGAVLGSLCANANEGRYHTGTADWVTRVSAQVIPETHIDNHGRPLDQAITMLQYSHRFGTVPGIGALAKAINRGANASEIQSLFAGQHTELKWIHAQTNHDQAFESLLCDLKQGYGCYLSLVQQPPALADVPAAWDDWADKVLSAHATFQLLAALRKGEFGVDALNSRCRTVLTRHGLIQESKTDTANALEMLEWYAGRPVMITSNDYNLQLMNGDIGITLPYPNPASPTGLSLRVAFRDTADAGHIRWILPTRLQQLETVFAMTVHKSQGSEFAHTAMVLPAHDSPILTRELIYTGVTRASKQFTLICSKTSVLEKSVQTRVFRAGGLEL
ncbi:MAG: exodeoxyribonuclease V subunit alpha [Pseudohongiella sp.]|nr:exodeoxyribonuclease V subunit alpha [Pseudohongiella sp.]